MPKILHGKQAVAAVERNLARQLTRTERRVVQEEGYSKDAYRDTKQVLTQGVGQTGRWIERGFEKALEHHVQRAKRRVPNYDELPEYLQAELTQSEYRGDLGGSPTAVRLFNEGKHFKAADEFLDHAEYKDPKTSPGIKKRIKATSDAMREYGREMASLRVKQTTGVLG